MGLFGFVAGYATVGGQLSADRTVYPFGPLSDLVGQRLVVLERNRDGDCLCLNPSGNGIADISAKDIIRYESAR